MHCHTTAHSACSVVDPVTMIRQIVKMHLQGAILTEHRYLWSRQEISELRAKAEVSNNFLILSAQEVETDIGHVLVYGGTKSVEDIIPLKELRKMFPEAALVWAHPFRHGKTPSKDDLLNPLLDGLEIFSMNQNLNENYLGLRQWHRYKFTAISGSDAHEKAKAGVFPSQFDHPVETIEDVAEEIKHARCRPFFKEIPKSGANTTVTEVTIGTKGADEWRNRMIIRSVTGAKEWEKTKKSVELIKTLYNNGFKDSVFRVPKIIEENDREKLIIEEGQRGKSLYDVLLSVSPAAGMKFFGLTARWLAKLHGLKLETGNPEATAASETRRFDNYRKHFKETKSPYLKEITALTGFVENRETEYFKTSKESFIANHGDYHPKNIIVGQDKTLDQETAYISVIDFGSSMIFLPAFDVGYFLSQFENQFSGCPEVLKNYKETDFIRAYMEEAGERPGKFEEQVKFFRIRANLSIASFLVGVGKGESAEIERIIRKSLELMKELED